MQTKVNGVAIRATNATGAGKTSTLKMGDKRRINFLRPSINATTQINNPFKTNRTKKAIMQTKVNSVAIRATNATGAGKTSTLKLVITAMKGSVLMWIYPYQLVPR
jgi:predicted GTPase